MGICTYMILASTHIRATHALHATTRSSHQPIPLQTLVILNMFGELAEGVARRRTFRAA